MSTGREDIGESAGRVTIVAVARKSSPALSGGQHVAALFRAMHVLVYIYQHGAAGPRGSSPALSAW